MKFPQILKWWRPSLRQVHTPEPIYIDRAQYDAVIREATLEASRRELERQVAAYFPGDTVSIPHDHDSVVDVRTDVRPICGRPVIWR